MSFEVDEIVFPVPQSISKPGWFSVCRALFAANQCKELIAFAEEHGRFYKSGGQRIKRDVQYCFLRPEELQWPFEKIATAFARYNIWNFALSGIVEPIRIQKYGISGYTRPHSDYDYTSSDMSKITAILPLVPARAWSGGELTVAGKRMPKIERGDCLFFPSFAWHAVSPVTRGERVVLSAWCAGPRLV
jgi:2-oxoglutarate-Fe(II)-dependent oxygenase superfamily protein